MDQEVHRLPCAVGGCDGVVRPHPSGALACGTCGAHVTVWRVPAISARARFASPALRRALFSQALLLVSLGAVVGFGSASPRAPFSAAPSAIAGVGERVDFGSFERALREGRLPAHADSPAFYADPQRFLTEPALREASGPYLAFWQAQGRAQRLELLKLCTQAANPALLPFLVEISWHTIAREHDFAVASSLCSALHACARDHVELAILCMEHIASESAFTEVASDARTAIDGLQHRARVLGR
jgi:hypothetical protein